MMDNVLGKRLQLYSWEGEREHALSGMSAPAPLASPQLPRISLEEPYLCLCLLRRGNVSPARARSKCRQHSGIRDMPLDVKKTANPFIIFFLMYSYQIMSPNTC